MMGNSMEDVLLGRLLPAIRDLMQDVLREAMAGLRPLAPGEFLNVAQAAKLANVSKDTVRGWVKSGKIQRHAAGNRIRVRREELERFLVAGSQQGERRRTPEEIADDVLSRARRA